MPPIDDNAEHRLAVVWRALQRGTGATDGLELLMRLTRSDDRSADVVWRDKDGRMSVCQSKHTPVRSVHHTTLADFLLSGPEAQRAARASVLIFIVACSYAGDEWAQRRRRTPTVAATGWTTALHRLALVDEPAADSDQLVELVELLAAPATTDVAWDRPFTTALTDLLATSMRHWSAVAAVLPVLVGADEMPCPADPSNWLVAELGEWFASAASVRPLQAVAAAHHATMAAYEARNAVVHEDPSIGREAVAQFTSTWLGFRPTPEIVEATAAALLYAPLDDFDPEDNSTAIQRLRLDTVHQNRMLKPLTSTQLCRLPIDSLDRPLDIVVDDDAPVTVGDAVGVPDLVDEIVARISGWNDDRIGRVLARLRPDEQRVALVYAHQETPTTWQQAAQACGLPAEFGERVRRKLRREGQWLHANQARADDRRKRAA